MLRGHPPVAFMTHCIGDALVFHPLLVAAFVDVVLNSVLLEGCWILLGVCPEPSALNPYGPKPKSSRGPKKGWRGRPAKEASVESPSPLCFLPQEESSFNRKSRNKLVNMHDAYAYIYIYTHTPIAVVVSVSLYLYLCIRWCLGFRVGFGLWVPSGSSGVY